MGQQTVSVWRTYYHTGRLSGTVTWWRHRISAGRGQAKARRYLLTSLRLNYTTVAPGHCLWCNHPQHVEASSTESCHLTRPWLRPSRGEKDGGRSGRRRKQRCAGGFANTDNLPNASTPYG